MEPFILVDSSPSFDSLHPASAAVSAIAAKMAARAVRLIIESLARSIPALMMSPPSHVVSPTLPAPLKTSTIAPACRASMHHGARGDRRARDLPPAIFALNRRRLPIALGICPDNSSPAPSIKLLRGAGIY